MSSGTTKDDVALGDEATNYINGSTTTGSASISVLSASDDASTAPPASMQRYSSPNREQSMQRSSSLNRRKAPARKPGELEAEDPQSPQSSSETWQLQLGTFTAPGRGGREDTFTK